MADDHPTAGPRDAIIEVRGVVNILGGRTIHDHLDLDVMRGEVMGVVGGSGAGKSVLLRTIIGLNTPVSGTVKVFGNVTTGLNAQQVRAMQTRWGVLFQDGALFSSLTVAENIMVPLKEHTFMSQQMMREIAAMKISVVGLPDDTAKKYPSELSGGMRKRAGLARALALDPELVFLDEPTSGLDPISSAHFDELVQGLQKSLGLTVFMITHDLDSLKVTTDRIAVLVDKKIHVGTVESLRHDPNPWIHEYFCGPRGRIAFGA